MKTNRSIYPQAEPESSVGALWWTAAGLLVFWIVVGVSSYKITLWLFA